MKILIVGSAPSAKIILEHTLSNNKNQLLPYNYLNPYNIFKTTTMKDMLIDSRAKIWNSAPDIETAKEWILTGYSKTGNFHETNLGDFYVEGKSCLDFGCGLGRNFDILKKHYNFLDGYDLPNMLNLMSKETKLKLNNLYSDWDLVKIKQYDIIHACLVLQHIDEIYLRSYLQDFVKMSPVLLVTGRSWLDDEQKNVMKIILDYYDVFKTNTDIEYCLNVNPKEHFHYSVVFLRKNI